LPVDEEVGEDRDDREGDDERREQRERDRQREGEEELADEATGEAERQEDRDGRQRARGDRAGDFAGAVEDGLLPFVAERPVAEDVLEDDDRVVDDAPTATARPPSVRMFSVIPATCMITSAVRIESGMLTAATNVERTFSRNRKIVMTAKIAPRPPSRSRPCSTRG
jgi:hypothetical protein